MGTEFARHLPRDAEIALLIPNLGGFGEKLRRLEQLKISSLIAQLQGFESASDYITAVTNQIGLDFRSPKEIAKAGINPDQGLGIAVLPQGSLYALVGVQDATKFREALLNFARNHWGATVQDAGYHHGRAWTSLATVPDAAPQIRFSIHGQAASILLDREVVTSIPGEPATGASLSEDALWSSSVQNFSGSDLYLHFPKGSALGRAFAPSGMTAALDLTSRSVVLRARIPGSGALLRALEKQEVGSLVGALPDDAFLLARFAGRPESLGSVLQSMWGSGVERAFRETGFDFSAQVLSNLQPGVTAAVSLSPTALLSSMPTLDVRRTNPFRFIHLVAIAKVKDAAKAEQALSSVQSAASQLGANIVAKDIAGRRVFVSSYGQGEGAHFAVVEGRVLVASPLKRLEEALSRVANASSAQSGPWVGSDLRRELERGALDVVVQFPRLTDSIKGLPGAAWGVGGFAIKAAMLRWLTALDDVRALTLTVSTAGTGEVLQAEMDVLFTGS